MSMLPVTAEVWTKIVSPGESASPTPFRDAKLLNGAIDVPLPPAAADPFTYQIML
jgi:hypothetical protein